MTGVGRRDKLLTPCLLSNMHQDASRHFHLQSSCVGWNQFECKGLKCVETTFTIVVLKGWMEAAWAHLVEHDWAEMALVVEQTGLLLVGG